MKLGCVAASPGCHFLSLSLCVCVCSCAPATLLLCYLTWLVVSPPSLPPSLPPSFPPSSLPPSHPPPSLPPSLLPPSPLPPSLSLRPCENSTKGHSPKVEMFCITRNIILTLWFRNCQVSWLLGNRYTSVLITCQHRSQTDRQHTIIIPLISEEDKLQNLQS